MKTRTRLFQPLIIASAFFLISATVNSSVNEIKTYNFTFNGTNCTINGDNVYNEQIIAGKTNLKYTIVPQDNYVLPSKSDIDCGSTPFEYEKGIITFPEPINGDIIVNAKTTSVHVDSYKFSFVGTGCTINGKSNFTETIPYGKEDVKFTISVPHNKRINITEGVDLVEFDDKRGLLTIPIMTSDVTVKASAIDISQINFSGTNCSAEGHGQDADMFQLYGVNGDEFEFALKANNDYVLPFDDITVEINGRIGVKGTDYEYKSRPGGTYNLSFTLNGNTIIRVVAVHVSSLFTVNFNSNGGSAVSPKTNIGFGDYITAPTNPTKTGYIFGGWYTDNETFNYKFDFANTAIANNFILYAKWNEIMITLDAGTQAEVSLSGTRYYTFSTTVGAKWGNLSEHLAAGIKDGYDFLYWTLNGDKVTDTTTLDQSAELIAHYETTSTQYLSFIPLNNNATIKVIRSGMNLQFKKQGDISWTNITVDSREIRLNIGEKLFFKGDNNLIGSNIFSSANSASYFAVSGKLSSIINDNFSSASEGVYKNLLSGFKTLLFAHNLLMPDETLKKYCYENMFENCTSLITAPKLPATTLASACYKNMFGGCSSLTATPELHSMNLATECYSTMFNGCASLLKFPELLATTLYEKCYYRMFKGCSSLLAAPYLPASTLANKCYEEMFCDDVLLKVSENSGKQKFVTFLTDVTMANFATSMFKNTGGAFKGTPSAGVSYYWN